MLDQLTGIGGKQYTLGPELGRGGEGAVYAVSGRPDLAIKVYAPGRRSDERRKKLRQMVKMGSPQLAKHAAWPIDLVDNGVFAVVMPCVSGIELHDLYGPKSRMVKMPKATFRFLITAAYNLCAALHEIHCVGAVVGDFNNRNILVGEDANVRFVDCDSFQIAIGSEMFKCVVGTPDQLAPELHGADLARVVRSPNHDNFTLAVLIFQLLFVGRHPFAGVGGPDDISEAIRRYLFAYGKRGGANGIHPPPHVPSIDTVPPALFALFERAFAEGSSRTPRPTATEWAQHLGAFLHAIVKCRVNSAHEYVSSRASCPWCELRIVLFLSDGQHVFRIDAASINELADKLEAAVPYTFTFTLPNVPAVKALPIPKGLDKKSGGFWFGIVLIGLASVGIATGYWLLAILIAIWATSILLSDKGKNRRTEYRKTLEAAASRAEAEKKAIEARMYEVHARYVQEFEAIRRRVSPLKTEYNAMSAKRQKAIGDLNQRLRQLQLEEYLDRQFISAANIPGIGAKRLATLVAYGIETAADVGWGMHAPGFGHDLTSKLVAWKQALEQGFRFNPNAQVDPREIQKLDAALLIRKNEIESEIKSINDALDNRTRRLRADLEVIAANLPAAAQTILQTKANLAEFIKASTASGSPSSKKLWTGAGIAVAAVAVLGVIIAIVARPKQAESAARISYSSAPPAPIAATSGTLFLSCNIDARVMIQRIDGPTAAPPVEMNINAGTAKPPVARKLKPGKYRLTFTAAGWLHAKTADTEIAAGKNTPVTMQFTKVDAEFTSVPAGADVKDGTELLGTTPFRLNGLTSEEHTFTFSETGRPDGIVTITPDGTSSSINYVWPVGNVTVSSAPNGAEVWNAGTKLGTTPLELPQIPIGQYQFTVVAAGFAAAEVHGVLKANETLGLSATLTDIRPGKLRISIAADGTHMRLTNIGERSIDLRDILVYGSDQMLREEISGEQRLDPNGSTDINCKAKFTPQMSLTFVGEPNDIVTVYQWEPPPPLPVAEIYPPKSIKIAIDTWDERLTIENRAKSAIRIQYVLIVRKGSTSPDRVAVYQEIAPRHSIHVALRTSIQNGDTIEVATEPSLAKGTIEFSSY